MCTEQPQHDNEHLDVYIDEMIVEGEEEVVGINEYDINETKESTQKPSTSSGDSFEMNIPPHRQASRPIQPHHLTQEWLELEKIKVSVKNYDFQPNCHHY